MTRRAPPRCRSSTATAAMPNQTAGGADRKEMSAKMAEPAIDPATSMV